MQTRGDWRTFARMIAGTIGIFGALAVALFVGMERHTEPRGGLDLSTVNIGLYVEGLFILGCLSAFVLAVYVLTSRRD